MTLEWERPERQAVAKFLGPMYTTREADENGIAGVHHVHDKRILSDGEMILAIMRRLTALNYSWDIDFDADNVAANHKTAFCMSVRRQQEEKYAKSHSLMRMAVEVIKLLRESKYE